MIRLLILMLLSTSAWSELRSMNDEALSRHSGQAIFKIDEYDSTVSGQTASDPGHIEFTRLTLGLRIELNQTIDRLTLGRYHRENGKDCHDGGRFCDNNESSFAQAGFAKWACSNSECGGITDDDGNNPYAASALVYGDLLGLSGIEKLGAALGGVLGIGAGAYTNGGDFNDSSIFPSGFERTTDADAQLRDVTMGRLIENPDGTKTLEDFVIEKPFVEFAYDGTGATKEVVGLRVGFGSQTGVMGNAIDVVTGFIQPVVSVTADIGLGSSAAFSFAPYLGGTRTPGYIAIENTKVDGCNAGGILGGIACGSVGTAEDIAHTSPQAQLFPLQNVGLNDSPTFWFSVQSRAITYEADQGEDYKFIYEEAQPGLWINMGAFALQAGDGTIVDFETKDGDGFLINSLDLLSSASGFSANTSKPLHPDNYFFQNTRNDNLYKQSNNYY